MSPGHGAHVACTDWVSAVPTPSLHTRERLLQRHSRCIPRAGPVVGGSCEGDAVSPGHGAYVACADRVSAVVTPSLHTRGGCSSDIVAAYHMLDWWSCEGVL